MQQDKKLLEQRHEREQKGEVRRKDKGD
jgi:hypothetical protein